jgi:hypothetical protein
MEGIEPGRCIEPLVRGTLPAGYEIMMKAIRLWSETVRRVIERRKSSSVIENVFSEPYQAQFRWRISNGQEQLRVS